MPSENNNTIEFAPVQHTPYSIAYKIRKNFWDIVNATIFRWSPFFARKYRVFLLRLFGANIDWSCSIHRKARIAQPWNLTMGYRSSIDEGAWLRCTDKVTMGKYCCVSHDVEITPGGHDINAADFHLVTAPIVLKDNVWIAARAFIHRGVTLGEGAVVSSCAVVSSQVPPWSVVAGNPARVVAKRELKG